MRERRPPGGDPGGRPDPPPGRPAGHDDARPAGRRRDQGRAAGRRRVARGGRGGRREPAVPLGQPRQARDRAGPEVARGRPRRWRGCWRAPTCWCTASSPGVAERLGFGAAEVTARHPRLVYCALSAFGPGPGPRQRHRGPGRVGPDRGQRRPHRPGAGARHAGALDHGVGHPGGPVRARAQRPRPGRRDLAARGRRGARRCTASSATTRASRCSTASSARCTAPTRPATARSRSPATRPGSRSRCCAPSASATCWRTRASPTSPSRSRNGDALDARAAGDSCAPTPPTPGTGCSTRPACPTAPWPRRPSRCSTTPTRARWAWWSRWTTRPRAPRRSPARRCASPARPAATRRPAPRLGEHTDEVLGGEPWT